MKKLVFLVCLVFSLSLSAQSGNLDGICSKIVKDSKYNYCLQIGSETAIHLFDVLPKIRDYKYTGDTAYNNSTNGSTIFYPTYQNTGQKYELKQYIKTDKGNAEMVVTLTDLDLADILKKAELEQTMLQMQKQLTATGIDIPEEIKNPSYKSNRLQQIEYIKLMHNAAVVTNIDYSAIEHSGIMAVNLNGFENAFINYSDVEKRAGFMASYGDRYTFSIEIKYADHYTSCSTALKYLSDYLSQVQLTSLETAIHFK
jgi:hypothetical protein